MHLRLPSAVLAKLKVIAKEEDRTQTLVARELIEESLFWREKHAADDAAKAGRR
jgi:predicted transcriptional regulator